MGWNTTVVVMNDCLGSISEDPLFGKKLAAAVSRAIDGEAHDVTAGGCVNAATVIETHHADQLVCVEVGRNFGKVVDVYALRAENDRLRDVLEEIARNNEARRDGHLAHFTLRDITDATACRARAALAVEQRSATPLLADQETQEK